MPYTKPVISIIIPIYNMAGSIRECVAGILRQPGDAYEIILVDDGSTDDSYAVCLALQKEYPRLKVCHTENRGSGPARNEGLSHAEGDYVSFVDADDRLYPDAVGHMVARTEGSHADLIVFGYDRSDRREVVFRKRFPDEVHDGAKIRADYADYYDRAGKYTIQGALWNKLFRLSVIREHDVRFPPLRRHQDDAFIARFMCYAGQVAFAPETVYIYYQNDLVLTWKKYSVQYIDSVIGLYEDRRKTILAWNPEDVRTREIVEREYIYNILKCLELSYSPKAGFTPAQRREWIRQAIGRSGIRKLDQPKEMLRYQRVVFSLIRRHRDGLAVGITGLKVALERAGIVDRLKKLRK